MEKPVVYLNDPVSPSVRKRLEEKVRLVENYDHPEELDAIIVRQAYCPRSVIENAPRLKIISMHGTGTERIDLEAAEEYHVPVIVHSGYNSRSVAELSVAQLMAMNRKLKEVHNGLLAGKYHTFGDPFAGEHEVFGKTLGLVGTGAVAKEVARIMQGGFSVKVLAYNAHRTPEELAAMGFEAVGAVKELFARSDLVSVCVALNDETRNMIDKEVFDGANQELVLSNVSRGGIVNEDDLYEALTQGKIKAAASDVFLEEPAPRDHPLLKLENFMGSFHIGGSTAEAMERLGNATVDDVFRALGL